MCLPLEYRESLLLSPFLLVSFFVPHVSLACCTLLLSILDSLTLFFLLLFLFSFDDTLLCNMCERLGLKDEIKLQLLMLVIIFAVSAEITQRRID